MGSCRETQRRGLLSTTTELQVLKGAVLDQPALVTGKGLGQLDPDKLSNGGREMDDERESGRGSKRKFFVLHLSIIPKLLFLISAWVR
jgi:hypothetical protein